MQANEAHATAGCIQAKLHARNLRSSWRMGRDHQDPKGKGRQPTRCTMPVTQHPNKAMSSSEEDTSFFLGLSILRPNSSYLPQALADVIHLLQKERQSPPSFFLGFALTFAFALGFTTFLRCSRYSRTTLAASHQLCCPRFPSFASSRATARPERCTSSPSRVKVKVILKKSCAHLRDARVAWVSRASWMPKRILPDLSASVRPEAVA